MEQAQSKLTPVNKQESKNILDWSVIFISKEGISKQLTRAAYGLEAAKDLERRLTDEVKSNGNQSAKKMTVRQLFDEYINAKKYEVKESTIDKAIRDFDYYILPMFADVRIDRLTMPMLQDWKLSMEQKGLAYRTKKQAFGDFRVMLNYAVKMEYLASNPIVKVGNFKNASGAKTAMSIYTGKEFMRFIGVAKEQAELQQAKNRELSGWDFYVFFAVAFYTGLRKGEIHALKWSDLDGAFLSVSRSINQRLRGGDRETTPKTKSSVRTLQTAWRSLCCSLAQIRKKGRVI
jgi:integrase